MYYMDVSFCNLIFTSFATHKLYVVENRGIFGLWKLVGGGGC